VDLDHTLVQTNTLIEAMVCGIRRNPILILLIPWWGLRGQAYVWNQLARLGPLPQAALLPYSQPVLEWVRQEAATGRTLVLASGAHREMAQRVADHIGLFTGVVATGEEHMVGNRKADALRERFGAQAFDYMGDSSTDLPVFRICRRAYVVASTPRLADRLKRESIAAEWLPAKGAPARGLWLALRPKQWMKNALVALPLLLGHQFRDLTAVVNTMFAAILFCCVSSSVYLLNDIVDVEADRQHRHKRLRPFASGGVSIQNGFLVCGLLVLAGLAGALLLNVNVALLLALYLLLTFLYSVWLKTLLMIDMVCLAGFYAMRVYVGSAATGIPVSSWTALFCLFLFFSLAAVKRYAEVRNRIVDQSATENRRAYFPEDAASLLAIGTASFVGAVIALGLYLGSPNVQGLYRTPDVLWLTCPILLGWFGRIWLLVNRGELQHEDPLTFAMVDRWSHVAGLLCLLIFWFAL
jgi:4-hydroxybenzoate polyprenyltransferase